MNSSQAIIFSVTFLAVSIVANVMLFQSNTTKADRIEEQSKALSELDAKIQNDQSQTRIQTDRIDVMDDQQHELAAIIQLLQSQITELDTQYQQTVETATLTQKQLKLSISQATQLDFELKTQKQQLAEAQKIIKNQQRLIRSSATQSENTQNIPLQTELTTLSLLINEQYNDISLTQTSTGDGVIDIPLNHLFESGTLQLNQDTDFLLTTIASSLKQFPEADIVVLGHSDARPIVSDLGTLYPTNWELSSVRASKIVNRLIELGVSDQKLTAAGRAANTPIRTEASEEAWSINRRVEIRIAP